MKRECYLYDGKMLRAKFTVEERADGMFLSTTWLPDWGSEVDRNVEEFETYSAALADMYENALIESCALGNLNQRDTPKSDVDTQ